MRTHWSLAHQYLVASLLVLLVNGLCIGTWVGQEIERNVLHNAGADTGLLVTSLITPDLQALGAAPRLTAAISAVLDGRLSSSPLRERIVALKIWSPDGTLLYTPDRQLVGQHFPLDDDIRTALAGQVSAAISDLREPENADARQHWSRLVQVYVPVRAIPSGRVLGCAEFYLLPDFLEHDIATARLQSWGVVAGLTLATYLLLAGIVGRGSRTIHQQRQALNAQVVALSHLVHQNGSLAERVRQAAGRTTTLSEQALHRISADLHDGPAQMLALALLKMDSASVGRDPPGEIAIVQGAVQDALREIRNISAGLLLPELAGLPVCEVVSRAVRDHERRSGTVIQLCLQDLPEQVPLPVMITLFRSLQEALSNATRYAGGVGVAVRVWTEQQQLCLSVSDQGPGIMATPRDERSHLGLAGMRERAHMLGGDFQLRSAPGEGTLVSVWWPLRASADTGTAACPDAIAI